MPRAGQPHISQFNSLAGGGPTFSSTTFHRFIRAIGPPSEIKYAGRTTFFAEPSLKFEPGA